MYQGGLSTTVDSCRSCFIVTTVVIRKTVADQVLSLCTHGSLSHLVVIGEAIILAMGVLRFLLHKHLFVLHHFFFGIVP